MNVSPAFPNFRFDHIDLYNSLYNETGVLRSEDFRFPYPDGSVRSRGGLLPLHAPVARRDTQLPA